MNIVCCRAGAEQTPHLDEQLLVKQASSLTPEDRELLNIYHHSFDDEKVDIDLVMTLLSKIHTEEKGGKYDIVVLYKHHQCEFESLRKQLKESVLS